MNKTGRIITLLLALSLVLGASLITSCTGSGGQDTETTTQTTTTTTKTEDVLPTAKDVTVRVTVKDQYGNSIPGVRVRFTDGSEVLFSGDTDENGALTLTVKEGSYTVNFENTPEGYLAIPENVTVSESSADFAFVITDNRPDGSVERPFFLTENETEVTFPASATYNFTLFGKIRIFTVISHDIKVTFNDTEYLPDAEGKITFRIVSEEANTVNHFTVTNMSDKEITLNLQLSSPAGYSDNPIVITELDAEQTASVPRESIVYYRYEVKENGYLMVCSENKLNNISMANLTTSVVTVFSSGSYCEYFAVKAGDSVQIAVASFGVDEINEIKFTLKQFKGDESDPIEMAENVMSIRLEKDGAVCFAFVHTEELDTLVIKNADVKVRTLWNDREYTPDSNGVITISLTDLQSQEYVFKITNTASAMQEVSSELKNAG